jgi:hypothetical protein
MSRLQLDPECVRWATFAELRKGDEVDYWGKARPVVDHIAFPDGRVRIITQGPHGQDMALAPGDEGTWRKLREGEER